MTDSRLGRRRFLGTAASAAVATVATTAATPSAVSAAPATRPRETSGPAATFRWLGTSGWRIDIGARTVLVDPYLSRFDTGLFNPPFNPATPLTVDVSRIADHPGTPQTILVTHTHWDHYNDVPHIAAQSGARVFGTLTAYHLGLAYGLPTAQLSPVKGGEVLDFGDYTVEVVSSLHSRNGSYSMAFPGVRPTVPAKPATIADLPEGDTLAFQVTPRGGPSVFFMGASDFAERNLAGLAPDVAMIAVPNTDSTHEYVPRLLAALDWPATVVPVHWDNFETELTNPPPVTGNDQQRLDAFLADVRRVAPRTRILLPEYLTPYTFA
ncbi:L-ascorbate metabolism protein UlaG, beta-lactamase superfamily [Micromonospora pallida]|uniref:L-ascorbate metabolism protein UlaG, beta-lactamase superfamily n=1 Tax=Micromonospora pallida TaxID=145854 RepID=A0A1C6RK15_9ACTN|nr:MBL fold metallo-hydrolase [Micromonospora pallida]SCL17392.1 L-ascorbate metabolism protein UlaG, beta-lactamase superfamily [Micromonospora pallida]